MYLSAMVIFFSISLRVPSFLLLRIGGLVTLAIESSPEIFKIPLRTLISELSLGASNGVRTAMQSLELSIKFLQEISIYLLHKSIASDSICDSSRTKKPLKDELITNGKTK